VAAQLPNTLTIDTLVNKFRIASRELFNNYFLEHLQVNDDVEFDEHFSFVEEHLFRALVTLRAGIPDVTYGCVQPSIVVSANSQNVCGIPIMLNRDIDSGYWDHDIDTAMPGCTFTFLHFFDWDEKSYRDNRYVRAVIREWPGNASLVGKHALIETQYVSYSKV
jgi:hypothetical protein